MTTRITTLVAITAVALGSLSADAAVGNAIRAWQITSGVAVTPEAQVALSSKIPEIVNDLALTENRPGNQNPDAYDSFVRESLTLNFLTWARNRRAANGAIGIETLTSESLVAYTTALRSMSGRPVGRLDVTSEPTQADIEVDGQPKGPTAGEFLASPGSHTVVVRPSAKPTCNRTVTVSAGKVTTVDCR